jgi:signal transduction histidine kinase
MMAGGSPAASRDAQPHILPLRGTSSLADHVGLAIEATRQACPGVRLSCDVDPGIGMHVNPQLLTRVLETLVRQAAEAAAVRDPHSDLPPLREVVVTAVDTPAGLEIEVADSGAAREAACPAEVAALAARLGGSLAVAACPEGGMAVTLSLPRRRAQGMAA